MAGTEGFVRASWLRDSSASVSVGFAVQASWNHTGGMPRLMDSLARGSAFRFCSREASMPVPERKPKFARVLVAGFIALLSGLLIIGAFHYDAAAQDHIKELRGKGWKKSSQYRFQGNVSRYGDWPWLMVAGGVGLAFAWRARNREWKRILITAMVASTVAGALVNTLRLTTGRTRPNAGDEIAQGWYGPYHAGKLTIGEPKFNSFPSGHTATAVGFAGVLLLARPWLGIPALLAALGIAWSRMLLGAHHLSDVTVATLFAILVAWICWRVALSHGDEIAAWIARKFHRKP
jgi:membrane-associated phospholipid phosphatase